MDLQVVADAVIESSHRKRCDFAARNAAGPSKCPLWVVFDHGARANRTAFNKLQQSRAYDRQNLQSAGSLSRIGEGAAGQIPEADPDAGPVT